MASGADEGCRRLAVAAIGVSLTAGALALAGAIPAAADSGKSHSTHNQQSDGHNPPGNNGTVFIHDVAGDHSPHNVPHVGCTFYVDFFGFDQGQSVTMAFAGQAPTGKGTALPFSPSTVDVGADDAGGAGNDFDAEVPVTLDTSVLGTPQAQQGYHVKLTLATGEPGGVKHKVFWIAPCTQTTPTSGGTGPTTGNNGGGTPPGGTPQGTTPQGTTPQGTTPQGTTPQGSTPQGSTPPAGTSGTGTTSTKHTTSGSPLPTEVLGESFHRNSSTSPQVLATSTPRSGTLPFTGAEIGTMVAAAAAALGGGLALLRLGRRRKAAAVR